jgi:hypothetical protein
MIPVANVAAYQSGSGERAQIAPDHSLASAAYIRKGLPANDRVWDGGDYLQAAKVLRELAGVDATQLPRYGSAISGAVFARIVSPDNFKVYDNELLDPQQKFKAVNALLQGVGEITIIYSSATTKVVIFDTELIELMRFILELCADDTRLFKTFTATLPTNQNLESRAKSEEQMRQGMARVVVGCLEALASRESYRSSDLERLAQTLDTTVPVIHAFLLPGAQQEVSVRLQKMIEEEPNPRIKDRLRHLVAALAKPKAG